jgi:hypothetical protein
LANSIAALTKQSEPVYLDMKKLHQLLDDIARLTANIETNYPELYKYLGETPLNLGKGSSGQITTADLENYLETLKDQLHHHIETHSAKKK